MMQPPAMRRRSVITAGSLAAAGSVLGLGAGAAWAQTVAPPEISGELGGAQLAGSSRMRFFGLSIYDARLWVAPGFRAAAYAQHALALELTYLRSLSGKAIAERSLKEMRRAGTIAADLEQRWLGAMQDAFLDVKEGDRLTGMHLPSVGAVLVQQPRATIRDAEFSRLFLASGCLTRPASPPAR